MLKTWELRNTYSLVIPGATFMAPWVVWLPIKFESIREYLELHQLRSIVGLIILILIAGRFMELFGSWWEVKVNDNKLTRADPKHEENWYAYLRLAFKIEPVASHYLKDVLASLKFELNEGISLIIGAISVITIWRMEPGFLFWPALAVVLPAAIAGFFLLLEAYHSSKILARIRAEMLKGITVV